MLTDEWLSVFAPVGVLKQPDAWQPLGAGVLFHTGSCLWLLTADHVIRDASGEHVAVLVNHHKDGMVVVDLTEVHQQHDVQWVRNPSLDVAASLMPSSPDWNIKAATEDFCISLKQILPSMPCYTVGCPYGVATLDQKRATPLVLDGVVSGVNPDSRLIYISAPTFPGNSGGPVLVIRVPYDPGGSLVVGRPTVLLAGLVREMALVQANGSSHAAPALHLGIGVSIEVALELLKSEVAVAQMEKLGLRA